MEEDLRRPRKKYVAKSMLTAFENQEVIVKRPSGGGSLRPPPKEKKQKIPSSETTSSPTSDGSEHQCPEGFSWRAPYKNAQGVTIPGKCRKIRSDKGISRKTGDSLPEKKVRTMSRSQIVANAKERYSEAGGKEGTITWTDAIKMAWAEAD